MQRMKSLVALVAIALVPVGLQPAFGAGGGGSGGGGSGGGGGVKTCTPSVAVSAAVPGSPTYRTLTVTYATNCASRSKVGLTATNLRTNVVEWALADNGLTTNSWAAPQWNTTYRIDARVTDNTTGTLMTTGSATVTTPKLPADCGPTLSLSAAAGTTGADWGISATTNTFWCQGPTNVYVTMQNAATGAVEYSQYTAAGTATFPHPRANTTYNLTATAYDGLTGSALTSAVGTVAVGDYPANCGPTMGLSSTAGTTSADWGVTVAVNTVFCLGPTNAYVTFTNSSTGAVEFSGYASAGSVFVPRPHGTTTYDVAATLYDAANGSVLTTATDTVSTGTLPPNCATLTNFNITTGYWGIYPAIWISTTAKDCGYGGQHVHVQVTDVSTGDIATQYDTGMSSLIDFEGAVVKYGSDYRFDVDVRGADNEVLDTRSAVVTSAPLR